MNTTHQVQVLLDELKHGKMAAKSTLLAITQKRFRSLAHNMLRRSGYTFPIEDTDDLLQQTLLRLNKLLENLQPETAQQFFFLSSKQMRWALSDMGRSYVLERKARMPQRLANPPVELSQLTSDSTEPTSLEEWVDFHEAIERLPDQDKETFNLLYYQGLPQAESAEMLSISLRTLKYRWQTARLHLSEMLLKDRHD